MGDSIPLRVRLGKLTVYYVVSYGQIICSYCGDTLLMQANKPCSGPCSDQRSFVDVMCARSGWALWGEPRLRDFAILGCKGVPVFGLADLSESTHPPLAKSLAGAPARGWISQFLETQDTTDEFLKSCSMTGLAMIREVPARASPQDEPLPR